MSSKRVREMLKLRRMEHDRKVAEARWPVADEPVEEPVEEPKEEPVEVKEEPKEKKKETPKEEKKPTKRGRPNKKKETK